MVYRNIFSKKLNFVNHVFFCLVGGNSHSFAVAGFIWIYLDSFFSGKNIVLCCIWRFVLKKYFHDLIFSVSYNRFKIRSSNKFPPSKGSHYPRQSSSLHIFTHTCANLSTTYITCAFGFRSLRSPTSPLPFLSISHFLRIHCWILTRAIIVYVPKLSMYLNVKGSVAFDCVSG